MNKLIILSIGLLLNFVFSLNIILNTIPIIKKLQLGGIIYQDNGVPDNISVGGLFYLFTTFLYIFISFISFLVLNRIFSLKQKVLMPFVVFVIINILSYFVIIYLEPLYKVQNSVYGSGILGQFIYFIVLSVLFLVYSILTFIKSFDK